MQYSLLLKDLLLFYLFTQFWIVGNKYFKNIYTTGVFCCIRGVRYLVYSLCKLMISRNHYWFLSAPDKQRLNAWVIDLRALEAIPCSGAMKKATVMPCWIFTFRLFAEIIICPNCCRNVAIIARWLVWLHSPGLARAGCILRTSRAHTAIKTACHITTVMLYRICINFKTWSNWV